jgi:hypothetical protein
MAIWGAELLLNRCIYAIGVALATSLVAVGASCSPGAEAATRLQLLDLAGRQVNPFEPSRAKATVFIFVRTDCPVSNRYAPEIRRVYEEFIPRGAAFWLVYVDPSESAETIREHMKEYDYRLGALRDPKHALVRMTGARVTPEAAVFRQTKGVPEMVYRGRIDDRYVDLGKMRPAPTTHDLERVLQEIVNGKQVSPETTQAVGCFISDLK